MATMSEQDVPQKLLWVDLEMTGLDPQTQRIIEVAALVTDFDLQELGCYEAVIYQPKEVLAAAEEWPKEHMQELFEEVRSSEKIDEVVTAELTEFIDEHFAGEPATLAGNSIHQDRRFIRQWWPEIDAKLHYRMLDVSSYKVWIQGALGGVYEKKEAHRALGDIRESIDELRWSLEQLKG